MAAEEVMQRLAALGSQVQAMTWKGQAQASFENMWVEWQNSWTQLQSALTGISSLLNSAATAYNEAETSIVSSMNQH